MPTSTEKALREFFTEERLEDYRDLHESFPLWCGDWPEPECLEPEYGKWWSRGARLVAAWSEAFGGDIGAIIEDARKRQEASGRPVWQGPASD